MLSLFKCRSRGSVDRDKKTVGSDASAETYDNVPLDNDSSIAAQNGFVSIIASKFLALLVCLLVHLLAQMVTAM